MEGEMTAWFVLGRFGGLDDRVRRSTSAASSPHREEGNRRERDQEAGAGP